MQPAHFESEDKSLPRLLCLHGGGSNALIFRAQCRGLRKQLRLNFRFCFAQASYPTQPGPDVASVYRSFGPCWAWIPWPPEEADPPVSEKLVAADRIKRSLQEAMARDDALGGTGEWMGLVGFSQGARVCASILSAQQWLLGQDVHIHWWTDAMPVFRFGILMAGRGSLIPFSPIQPLRQDSMRIPTLHVHGLRDPRLALHRQLLENHFNSSCARVVEWNGDHRVVIKSADVGAVVRGLYVLLQMAPAAA